MDEQMISTDQDIKKLIQLPKNIKTKSPPSGYREAGGHRRCDLDLYAISDRRITFTVFIRQSSKFIENFSIGLQYQTNKKVPGTITLTRYNGPHGDSSNHYDGHYHKPHIHRITADEIRSGSIQPQEKFREVTTRYGTFEEALIVFFDDIKVSNMSQHFEDISQGRLFDEY